MEQFVARSPVEDRYLEEIQEYDSDGRSSFNAMLGLNVPENNAPPRTVPEAARAIVGCLQLEGLVVDGAAVLSDAAVLPCYICVGHEAEREPAPTRATIGNYARDVERRLRKQDVCDGVRYILRSVPTGMHTYESQEELSNYRELLLSSETKQEPPNSSKPNGPRAKIPKTDLKRFLALHNLSRWLYLELWKNVGHPQTSSPQPRGSPPALPRSEGVAQEENTPFAPRGRRKLLRTIAFRVEVFESSKHVAYGPSSGLLYDSAGRFVATPSMQFLMTYGLAVESPETAKSVKVALSPGFEACDVVVAGQEPVSDDLRKCLGVGKGVLRKYSSSCGSQQGWFFFRGHPGACEFIARSPPTYGEQSECDLSLFARQAHGKFVVRGNSVDEVLSPARFRARLRESIRQGLANWKRRIECGSETSLPKNWFVGEQFARFYFHSSLGGARSTLSDVAVEERFDDALDAICDMLEGRIRFASKVLFDDYPEAPRMVRLPAGSLWREGAAPAAVMDEDEGYEATLAEIGGAESGSMVPRREHVPASRRSALEHVLDGVTRSANAVVEFVSRVRERGLPRF